MSRNARTFKCAPEDVFRVLADRWPGHPPHPELCRLRYRLRDSFAEAADPSLCAGSGSMAHPETRRLSCIGAGITKARGAPARRLVQRAERSAPQVRSSRKTRPLSTLIRGLPLHPSASA